MNKNLGKIDRSLRVIVGLVIIAAGIIYGSWLGAIGLVPLLTAVLGWCPLYCPLKINTCSKEECNISK